MKPKSILVACSALILLGAVNANAGILFPDPPGGWTYIYDGDQLLVGGEGSGWASLDGTWTHDNNSDAWDGSEIGGTFAAGSFGVGNGPGGTSLGTQSGITYLRMQDTGDPRDYAYADPSNRKVYFGHDIGTDIGLEKALTIMDTGVTLTFRARIPTLAKAGPPLDPLHRDGQQASGVQPYPENGDGYVTSDGGKGNFVIRQGGNGVDVPPGAIAFSFTQATDTTGGNPTANVANFAGLTFNEFNGNVPTANVNFGQGTKTNVVAFDPTDWHEVYIVIRKDPANIGTHEAFVFVDGNTMPSVFKMTAGTGADMNDSFLAMGGSATPQNWALDVDWFGYKDEAIFPPGAKLPPSISDFVPANDTMFHPAATGLSFTATARMPANTLPASGIKLDISGQDVSNQLTLTGSDGSSSRKATYNGLLPNQVYAATIIVTDSGGLSTTNELTFDTFVETQATFIEAEDYNYASGQFYDNPEPGAFNGLYGTAGVDFVDTTPNSLGTYRPSDAVDTATSADVARARFVNAGVPDYQTGTVGFGEWCNYTRTLASGRYNAWLRAASTAVRSVRLDRVTGNPALPNQTVELLGTFNVPRIGNLANFEFVPLTDYQGKPIAIPLAGKTTLRLTALDSNNDLALNFIMLMPAEVPTSVSVAVTPSPGAINVPGSAPLEVVIYDGGDTVNEGTVKVKVNGAEVPAIVAKTGAVTRARYSPAALWNPAATYAANLTFDDGTARSFDWTFTVANYQTLTPAMKVTDAKDPGFVWRVFQNDANQDTTVQRAEDALAGLLRDGSGNPLANLADPFAFGAASDAGAPLDPGAGTVTFLIPTVINANQNAGGGAGYFVPDDAMAGIPGTLGGTDGIAVEILTFIELPAGFYTMGVNSDDGFRTTAGFLNDTPLMMGEYNGGRSANDTLFQFGVVESGVYAFRTVYFEGGGDAAVEWFLVNADGTRALINDTDNGGPRSFQKGTIPQRPPDNVVISVRLNASGQVVLEWSSGTLQSSDSVNGQYQNVGGASSPFVVNPATAVHKFYRVLVR